MKKILISFLTATLLTSFVPTVFADATGYQSKTISIEEAMKPKAKFANGIGPSTNITVMNFSDSTVVVTNPTYNVLGRHSAVRITNDAYTGDTFVRVIDGASGQQIMGLNVYPLAMVKIDVEAGHYTYNIT
jgi:hypothetical protein